MDACVDGVEDLLHIPVPQRGERCSTVRDRVGLDEERKGGELPIAGDLAAERLDDVGKAGEETAISPELPDRDRILAAAPVVADDAAPADRRS